MPGTSRKLAIFAALMMPWAMAMGQGVTTTGVTMPPAPLLPEHFGPWQASTDPAASGITLTDAVAKELIVKRQDAKKYTAEGNAAVVSAVEMADATGAYSAWTLLRTADMHACAAGNSLGTDCAAAPGRLLFWKGDTVVTVQPAGTRPIGAASFNDLVSTLPKPSGAKGALPLLPMRLPHEGLEKDSLNYAVGTATYAAQGGAIPDAVLDWSKSPETLTARYRSSKSGIGTLTLLFYPTPQIAGSRLRAMEEAIASKSLPSAFLAGSPQVARSGPIVAIASNGFTEKQAAALVKTVKYEAEITWNKPEGYMDQFRITNAAGVMVQIMIFVLVMCGAALALGVVFGGGRAVFRLSRGKSISSIDDMEVISLGLRGRPNQKIH